ncbi:response regulator transcription factor [Pseudomonas capeferrum]|uniref:response regulator n=1 Tax=Pseudomonas capeferrum TaxID=1495066 RepID=UPI0015E3AF53|nr:response regulator transcription factor [Pseudomonas capeferrum]MBA1202088.1 response regulator transcription factor [Pseudomonas capeferrum]
MTCRLLLVDEHLLIRAGVRALVADIPDYLVVGEAPDSHRLVNLVEQLVPDIVLLNVSLGCTSGLDALVQLRANGCCCKVLILSMHDDPDLIMRSLESGAHGYLLKDTTATELRQALAALRNGERYLSPAIAHIVIDRALLGIRIGRQDSAARSKLTVRQLEILRLIARGKSTREIANGLGLSIKTVETHRSQIMKRLQIHDVAGLALFAVREKIISLDD